MWQKSTLLAVATAALCLTFISRAKAGVEMVEPERAPAPRYSYAPPPEPVYYPSPELRVLVYPAFGFYPRPYGYYRYYHNFGPHRYRRVHHWR